MVDEIRRTLKNVGTVSQLGRSFSWAATRSGSPHRDLEVAVSVRGGRTRITIHENMSPVIGAIFGGIGGGMGGGGMGPIIAVVASLHVPGPLLGLVLPLWLATTYVTARTVFQRMTRRRAEELAQLADTLAATAQALVPERPALRPPERSGRG